MYGRGVGRCVVRDRRRLHWFEVVVLFCVEEREEECVRLVREILGSERIFLHLCHCRA